MSSIRRRLERHQGWIYLAAAAFGLLVGTVRPAAAPRLDALIWPALALLLFTTFTQVPLRTAAAALADRRFLGAALAGNFVLMPLIAWAVVSLMPDDEALRLGMLLVLLVPCTDWFITFASLARGDGVRATALTPLNLGLQLLLLPLYLAIFAGDAIAGSIEVSHLWPAVAVVLVPLLAALVLESALRRGPTGQRWRDRLGSGPVPLLAVVIFAVVAVHAEVALTAGDLLVWVGLAALAFFAAGLLLARVLAGLAKLRTGAGRTLAFTLTTRNSFLVLPVALALPAGWEVAALVIVLQSLVELFAVIGAVWFVPRVLMPDRDRPVQRH